MAYPETPYGIIVEDGSNIPDSNSYLSVEEADYWSFPDQTHPWHSLSEESKSSVLMMATTWLDVKFRYYGQCKYPDQSLQWPRTKTYNDKGMLIQPGTIPYVIKKAVTRVAEVIVKMAGAAAIDDPDAASGGGGIMDGMYGTTTGSAPMKKFVTNDLHVEYDTTGFGSSSVKNSGSCGCDSSGMLGLTPARIAELEGLRIPEVELVLQNTAEYKDIRAFYSRTTDARTPSIPMQVK